MGGGGGGTSPFYRNFNISLWLNENKNAVISVQSFTKYSVFIADVKSGRFMYQSGRAGDEAKKRKSPAKSGRVGITEEVSSPHLCHVSFVTQCNFMSPGAVTRADRAPV